MVVTQLLNLPNPSETVGRRHWARRKKTTLLDITKLIIWNIQNAERASKEGDNSAVVGLRECGRDNVGERLLN